MRILVCGGRDYQNREHVCEVLDRAKFLYSSLVIIEGGASGADSFAREWAKLTGCGSVTVHADWKRHGKAAGPIRNQYMIDHSRPDLVIAFPGGRGTEDMINRATKAGLNVQREVF